MIVGDRGIRRLNRDYRGKDQATDVLSFPQLETSLKVEERTQFEDLAKTPTIAIGDVVISIDTARRQARELGQGVAARMRTLLIHGTLHLIGYDHEGTMVEARRMFAREHELAARLAAAGRRVRTPIEALAVVAGGDHVSTRAKAIGDGRWSPAAMPRRGAHAVKKSVV